MALNKNTKRTIIILSSLAAVIIIGIATGVITFDPVTKSKSNTYGKSEQCFAKLKKKLSKEKMLDKIYSKNLLVAIEHISYLDLKIYVHDEFIDLKI